VVVYYRFVLFFADVVRHIAFMEKIARIQCMSLKLIVKHTKRRGLTLLTAKMAEGFLRP